MFLFKKLVAPLFFPVFLCLECLVVGLILLWFTKKQKAGKIVTTVGVGLLLLFSNGPFSRLLLDPLVFRYPSLRVETGSLPRAKWIVVLGGGHARDPKLPVTSRLPSDALTRVVEGIRLHRKMPDAKLVFSGGGKFGFTDAGCMADVAVVLGVDRRDMILESKSRDTKDQARLIRDVVGESPFVLVTSSSHLPRSVALFRKQGMHPIPAPSGLRCRHRRFFSRGTFDPGAGPLQSAESAFYEYMGLAWAKLRGQI